MLFLVVCLTGCQNWTNRDTVLQIAATTATVIDWKQTGDITSNCLEANPLIGPCGHTIDPNVYFPITIGLTWLAAALLPGWYRTTFQAVVLGDEANQIWMNNIIPTKN